ncbi:MAG: hypothetical protein H6933_20550 [Burkholderiaceae bacterium]|nr:hypothetical protein [Burkholderiaceae bacterium]
MKHWAVLIGMAATALTAAAVEPVRAQPSKPGPVQAPFWGDALFHVYQGKTFSALTTLMASQRFGRVAPHADEAEATRGGLLLAYGLHREAEAVFTALAERGTTAALRDKAWFHLARIRWQRGLPAEADAALASVAGPLDAELETDRQLLAAQVRLALGDPAGAAARLQALAEDAEGTPYARYNLGVALLEGQRRADGRNWLDRLGQMPVTTRPPEERRALRDKANLTLGFDALRHGEPASARQALERVRLNGPFANPALLAFGWAALEDKAPRQALVPWQELLQRNPSDPAVLEARLAVPHALVELKADAAAVHGYIDALAAYTTEAQALAATITALQGGALVDTLIAGNPGADLGWGWTAETLPADLPHRAQLAPVLATHAWQSALKDQRDLRFFLQHLGRWQRDLQSFDTMLATREQRFAAMLPAARDTRLADTQGHLAKERAALTGALDTADARTLADERERGLIERLERAQRTLAALPDDDNGRALRERVRRVASALEWQLSLAVPERRWAARKALREIEAELARSAERMATLQAAQRDEPQRFAGFAERIAALRARIATLLPQVAALQAEQQTELQAVAIRHLQDQQARLAEYTTQARFALARLQDPATLAQRGDASEATDAPR